MRRTLFGLIRQIPPSHAVYTQRKPQKALRTHHFHNQAPAARHPTLPARNIIMAKNGIIFLNTPPPTDGRYLPDSATLRTAASPDTRNPLTTLRPRRSCHSALPDDDEGVMTNSITFDIGAILGAPGPELLTIAVSNAGEHSLLRNATRSSSKSAIPIRKCQRLVRVPCTARFVGISLQKGSLSVTCQPLARPGVCSENGYIL
ncbi:hypothetical protein GGI43DRAFT_371474 [Trichoderma evansii]